MADAEPGDDGMELVSSKVAADGTQTKVYIVKSGDNLSKISRLFYGEATNRNIDKIYDANKDKMPNKKTLKVGTPIEVPVPVAAEKDKTGDDGLVSSGKFDEVAELKPAGKAKDAPAVKESAVRQRRQGSQAGHRDQGCPQACGQRGKEVCGADGGRRGLAGDPGKDPSASGPRRVARGEDGLGRTGPRRGAGRGHGGEDSGEDRTSTRRMLSGSPRSSTRRPWSPGRTASTTRSSKGDTWYKLAAKFMGDSKRWHELYALNDDILPDATKLRTGVKIRVPAGKSRLDSVVE